VASTTFRWQNSLMLQQDAQGYRLPYPVRYPVELHVPPGFKAEDPLTWPHLDGRLEYVGGRLLYLPPCGDVQQDVAMEVAWLLKGWSRQHPGQSHLKGHRFQGVRAAAASARRRAVDTWLRATEEGT
jgi:hypothetical protein